VARLEHLERDVGGELEIARGEDLAHRPLAEEAQHAVAPAHQVADAEQRQGGNGRPGVLPGVGALVLHVGLAVLVGGAAGVGAEFYALARRDAARGRSSGRSTSASAAAKVGGTTTRRTPARQASGCSEPRPAAASAS